MWEDGALFLRIPGISKNFPNRASISKIGMFPTPSSIARSRPPLETQHKT